MVCLYVGPDGAGKKTWHWVRRSFSAIRTVQPKARMVWVGDGPSRQKLQEEHPEHVFAGTQVGEELSQALCQCRPFSLPQSFRNLWQRRR
jgi:hypothetical protein